ncbi:MAG: hypothetical protein LH624_15490, partial [Cryobacterium sp.]|nr:hypothetical protein [Cryobacterium sp.]
MTQLQIIGHRRHLDDVLIELQRLRAVEVAPSGAAAPDALLSSAPLGHSSEEGVGNELSAMSALLDRINRLLALGGAAPPGSLVGGPPIADIAGLVEL